MTSSKLIAIVSYLPDDTEVRQVRYAKIKNLIDKCNEIFDLPIFIEIQNYTDKEVEEIGSLPNVKLSVNHERLGICGARKQLREDCLALGYDYFIMLDDDSILEGSKASGDVYKAEIDLHPIGFANFKNRQLKLFAISKEVLAGVEYYDINPEEQVGFEDTIFIARCDNKFGQYRFYFPEYRMTDLRDLSKGALDMYSTWYKYGMNMGEMLMRTKEIIDKERQK